MPVLAKILHYALLVLVILASFNLIIFVHELGHFLAAKWRGLQIDRFQIWFGKPIWKKTVKGVQYGLGWIPAGGFVALPQMAPMESIEGSNADRGPLPKISPLDKIIVAFAGPLFSLLLALSAAGIVSQIGKPVDIVPTTTIGEVEKGSPGEKAGILAGDRILKSTARKSVASSDGWMAFSSGPFSARARRSNSPSSVRGFPSLWNSCRSSTFRRPSGFNAALSAKWG